MQHRARVISLIMVFALGLVALLGPGQSALALTGGPDAGGYTFIDDTEVGGPTFAYQDISATGTAILVAEDDTVAPNIPIGFSFKFYGTNYSTLTVSSNGNVQFASSSTSLDNSPVPTNDFGPAILPFWDDLKANPDVRYQTLGVAPNRKFVVQWISDWVGVAPFGTTPFDFEIILSESSNTILMQYSNVIGTSAGDLGGSATVGIQSSNAGPALPYSFNANALATGRAILFQPSTLLNPDPTTVLAGATAPMTVSIPTLQGTDTTVSLASSDGTIATVPASVIILAGQTSAQFNVTGVSVGGPVTITATPPPAVGIPATASVNVVLGITLTPASSSIKVGGTQTLTAAISQAQATNTIVTLASATPATVSVPASVTILTGQTSATFSATGVAVGGPIDITATLPVAYASRTATATVTVTAVGVALTPPSSTIKVGGTQTLTATIDQIQATDTTVTLVSATPATVSVPASVTILTGQTSATFSATGVAVGGPIVIIASLPAGLGNGTGTANVNVQAVGITLNPPSSTIIIAGTQTMTIAIDQIQATDTTVTLVSATPATVSVPATATILAGQTSVTFDATGVAIGGPIAITASLPAGLGGNSANANVTVAQVGVTLTPPNSTIKVGGTQTLTVVINPVQGSNTTVTLSSATPATVSVPASVVVLAGQTSATFNATGAGVGGPIAITATLPAPLGGGSASANVTVQAVGVTLTPASSTITAGTTQTLTVAINQVQASNTTVTLVSATPATVSVPASVVILAGQTSATFSATGSAAGGPVAITASLPAGLGGSSSSANVTVTSAPTTITLTTPTNTIRVGGTQTLTVGIGQVQATNTIITLSSATPSIVSVPVSVTIPAGQTSATFNATGVAAGGPVSITATLPVGLGGGNASVQLTSRYQTFLPLVIRA
ncbi:MAG: hypothetical protein SH847_15570 [Roseiflexaceae bacterium]|nr:hypothetical protein [Roseiflexaceae bacterium]